jgi:5-methyltetrahydropteroyltriglutamate--homocysteine methyltransferase
MRISSERILTTHVGSLPRPEAIRELVRARLDGKAVEGQEMASRVRQAVKDVVELQTKAGIDIVSDGEYGKSSFNSYAEDRLSGFESLKQDDPRAPAAASGASWSVLLATRREWTNFREYYEAYLPLGMPPSAPVTICTGPISYKGHEQVRRDLDNLRGAIEGTGVSEAFVPAIAPSMVGRGQNRYYPTEEAYRFAIAEAMHEEYRAIVEAGFILQIDDPG